MDRKLHRAAAPVPIHLSYYQLGVIVSLTQSFLREPAGTRAYVYEQYNIGNDHTGISLITENGVDLGGFNLDEQAKYLLFYKDTGIEYRFRTAIILHNDFINVIKPLFNDTYYPYRRIIKLGTGQAPPVQGN